MGADKKERPLAEVKILKALVFTNPIPEADNLLEQFIRKNMETRIASGKVKSVSISNVTSVAATATLENGNKVRKLV